MFHSLVDRHQAGSWSERRLRGVVSGQTCLINKLQKERELEGHGGCVNTVAFTPGGDTLISGSDDLRLILWNWQSGTQRLAFDSGHRNNVFQGKALPHTGDKTIVSCAADGQVRVSYLGDNGSVTRKKLGQHQGRAHKLSLLPDVPTAFISCGEDGEVGLYDLRDRTAGTGLISRMLVADTSPSLGNRPHVIDINAVHHNPARPWLFSVGGSDARTRVYDSRRLGWGNLGAGLPVRSHIARTAEPVVRLCPSHLDCQAGDHTFHITCVYYSRAGELLATYNYEDIYQYSAQGAGGQQQGLAQGRPSGGRSSGTAATASGSCGGGGGARKRKERSGFASGAGGEDSSEDEDGEEEGEGGSHGRRGVGDTPVEAVARALGMTPALMESTFGITSEHLSGVGRGRGGREGGSGGAGASAAATGSGRSGRAGDDTPAAAGRGTSSASAQAPQAGAVPTTSTATLGRGEREDHVVGRYTGHRNCQTVKGVSFYGANDEYVVSGSDCGHVFVWEAANAGKPLAFRMPASPHKPGAAAPSQPQRDADGEPREAADHEEQRQGGIRGAVDLPGQRPIRLLKGDRYVVNCLEPHPWQPLVLATSGIEDTIKIWAPTAPESQSMDPQQMERVLAGNSVHRQRIARRVAISPEALLALFSLRRNARERNRQREEEEEDGSGSSSGGEGEDAAEGTLMARLERLIRGSGGMERLVDLMTGVDDGEDGFDDDEMPDWAVGSSSSEDEDSDDEEDDDDDDDEEEEDGEEGHDDDDDDGEEGDEGEVEGGEASEGAAGGAAEGGGGGEGAEAVHGSS